jgi:hypothetical protein
MGSRRAFPHRLSQVATLRLDLLDRYAEPPCEITIQLVRMALEFLVWKEHAPRIQLRIAARERSRDLPRVDVTAVQAHRGHEAQLRVARRKRLDPRRQIHPASSGDRDELASIRNRPHAR